MLNILIICIITTTKIYFRRKANIIYIVSNQHIIVVFSSAKTLQISYIGMQTQEVAIKLNLRVVLKSDAQLIDEVVVTGYGVTKKAAFTGSAQTVDNKDLMKKTDANFMKSLEGSVAGLQVNSLTGQPGAYASTTIRGVGSMNSGTEPLYVIDGIAIYTDKMGAYNKAGTGDMAASPMANINPNDIESITVLKDASATAIYGARAANGVIVVTTKKGSLGKARFNVNAKVGTSFVGKIDHNYRTTNLDKYKEIWTEGLTNAGYDFSAIQDIVNEKLLGNKTSSKPSKTIEELAREVIRGDWGNGTDRKTRLTNAGYNYDAIQNRVNEILK